MFVYGTDPLVADTDGDGISDGAELKLGLDPLSEDSDQDGVLDGDEKIEQTLAENIECKESPEITEVSVSMNGTGLIEETTKIKNTFGIDMMTSDVVGLVGIPVDISTSSSFDEATIKFTYDDDLLGETSEENLRIMWYDEENNQYVIMDEETVLNTEENTLELTTDHFSTYLVVDRQEWYDAWSNAITYRRDPETPSIPVECFDICYIVDRSGSMSGDRITMAKDAISQFINAMYSHDRASIVGYDSSAKVYSNFTDNKQSLKSSLSSIYASGGTSVEAGLVAALDLFDSTEDNYVNGIANSKMILLLCDGDVSYNESTLERAKDEGIKIYPVLIGTTSGRTKLQHIADYTGGTFYYAATAEKIREAIWGIKGETIGDMDTTDTDGDGLYDIYETAGMMLPNGEVMYSNPLKEDTDEDGLPDAEEMGILTEYGMQDMLKQIVLDFPEFDSVVYAEYLNYKSDPNEEDTDGDGYNDDVDPNRLIPDVKIAKINEIERYVPVEYDGPEDKDYDRMIYYGGNQSWFYDEEINSSTEDLYIENGACGVLASTDLIMYLTLYHNDVASSDSFKLITSDKYSGSYISYADYTQFVRGLVKKNPPGTYRTFTKNGTLGYIPIQIKALLGKYFHLHDIDKCVTSERTKSIDRDKMIERIISQIEDDIPVPIMAGFNDERIMKRIDPITGEYILKDNGKIETNKLKTHWVNIVGVKIDDIKGDTMLEVASWGEKYLVDFDDYYNESALIDGVIWIE